MLKGTGEMGKSVRNLLILAGIIVVGCKCIGTFRFAIGALNSIFLYAYFLIPFLAIRPVLGLPQRYKTLGLILLTPLLLLASGFILVRIVSSRLEFTQPLQSFQLDSSTVELGRFHKGGALGVSGVYLEHRRLVIPGLYLVRSIDFFDHAKEASLSLEGQYSVRVHARGNYYDSNSVVDRVYSLKPWVYF